MMANNQHQSPGDEGVVRVPVEGSIDLHTFAPRDIPSVVEEYLRICRSQGILEVRVIHGKGSGFQKRVVGQVLKGLPFIRDFRDAPPEAGGWGALVVRLKPEVDSKDIQAASLF